MKRACGIVAPTVARTSDPVPAQRLTRRPGATRPMKRVPSVSSARVAIAVTVVVMLILAGSPGADAQITPPEAPDVEVMSELMMFTRGPNGPRVLHMIQLGNIGPRVAEQVPLSVPQGAVWLDVSEELLTDDGMAIDPNPLPVGEVRQYVLTYELPWQRLPMPVRRPLLYPTYEITMYAEMGQLHLRGVGLRQVAQQNIGDVDFNVYYQQDLQPSAAWQIVLESEASARLPSLQPAGQRSDPVDIWTSHPLPRLFLLTALLLAAGTIVMRFVKGRRPHVDVVEDSLAVGDTTEATVAGQIVADEAGAQPAPVAQRQAAGSAQRGEVARLKEEIVRLDVAFHNDELDQDVYDERRDELKRKLLSLMQGNKGNAGGRRDGGLPS